jgi:hypothetical protein
MPAQGSANPPSKAKPLSSLRRRTSNRLGESPPVAFNVVRRKLWAQQEVVAPQALRPDSARFPRWRTARAAPPYAPHNAARDRRLAIRRRRGRRRSRRRRSTISTEIRGSPRTAAVECTLPAECGVQHVIAAEGRETELDDQQRRGIGLGVSDSCLAEDERRRTVSEREPCPEVLLRGRQPTVRDEAAPHQHAPGEVCHGGHDSEHLKSATGPDRRALFRRGIQLDERCLHAA